MAIFQVSSVAQFNSALSLARGGDTIELAPGDYDGFISIKNRSFDPPLTITSADPENPAVFTGNMAITSVSGLIVDSVDFRMHENARPTWLAQIEMSQARNVEISNVSIEGRIARLGEGTAPDGFTDVNAGAIIEGYAFGRGVMVRFSEDVVLDGLEVSNLERGVTFRESDGVSILNSHIHDIRRDGLVVAGASDIRIEDNLFDSFKPFSSTTNTGLKDHPDFIQFFALNVSRGIDGMTISRNVLLQGNGGDSHAIFGRTAIKPPFSEEINFKNIVITDNIINIAHPHGISVSEVQSATVRGNILIPAPLDKTELYTTTGVPRITVLVDNRLMDNGGGPPFDVNVGGNLFASWSATDSAAINGIDPSDFAANGVVAEPDTTISLNPDDPSWFGRLFPGAVDKPVTDLAAILAAIPGGAPPIADWIIEAASRIDPNRPNDRVGGDGADALFAVPLGSRLFGGAGDDTLNGGDGIDVLFGQSGSDRMEGGIRGDSFVLSGGAGDVDVIVDLDFDEGDTVFFSEGFPIGFFRNGIDADNVLLTTRGGSNVTLDSDADIEELLATTFVRLGASRPEDVLLEFDIDRDGVADYRLLLEGYGTGRSFTDRNVAPLDSEIGKSGASLAFDFSTVLPLYAEMTTKEVQGRTRLLIADGTGNLLLGSAVGDTLLGGAGDDVLLGGAGDDYIIGAGGADRVLLDAALTDETDVIADLDFASGDVIEIFHPKLPALANGVALSALALGSDGASFVLASEAAIAELVALGFAEIAFEPGVATLGFPGAGGKIYSLQLFGYGEGLLRDLVEGEPGPSGPRSVEAALPDFAAGESLVIEGMPPGYFEGSGLAAPAGVSNGSAAVIASIDDLRMLIEAGLEIAVSPRGADRLELSLREGGAELLLLSLSDLEGTSSYRLAYGDPGPATFTGTSERDLVSVFGNRDDVVLLGDGDDYVRVVNGDNWIDGGAGNDTLAPQFGSDTLIGGAGADRFAIRGDMNADGDHDILADVDFTEGDVIEFNFFLTGTFEGGARRGRLFEADSAEDLVKIANNTTFSVERGPGDEIFIRHETGGAHATIQVMLDEESLAEFDSLFTA